MKKLYIKVIQRYSEAPSLFFLETAALFRQGIESKREC